MPPVKIDVSEGLEALDQLLYIVNEAVPAAAQATLERAANESIQIAQSVVPVKTGALRDSIRILEQGENYIVVGSDLGYAAHVEFGTSRMSARPYIGPAADAMNSRLSEIFAEELESRMP